jgi:hypothetical protein
MAWGVVGTHKQAGTITYENKRREASTCIVSIPCDVIPSGPLYLFFLSPPWMAKLKARPHFDNTSIINK